MPVTVDTSSWPSADSGLARRLDLTEGRTNAAFTGARAAIDPASGAASIIVAGVYAMFDGSDSPLTQTFGLGLCDPVGEVELAEIEQFFTSRGAPVSHEVAPFLSQDTVAQLVARGYRPIEFSNVMYRPTVLLDAAPSDIVVREIAPEDRYTWAKVAGAGWSSESEELAAFVEAFGRIITHARGVHCFLAEKDGVPIAAGALSLHDDTALLAGASTIPAGRRQGAQRALLEARLRFADEHGAGLAMVVAQPGSGSQRNAERQGFRVAYTRTKWFLPADPVREREP